MYGKATNRTPEMSKERASSAKLPEAKPFDLGLP